jgi:hypothetical protein
MGINGREECVWSVDVDIEVAHANDLAGSSSELYFRAGNRLPHDAACVAESLRIESSPHDDPQPNTFARCAPGKAHIFLKATVNWHSDSIHQSSLSNNQPPLYLVWPMP